MVARVTEITDGAMADVVLELTPMAAQPIPTRSRRAPQRADRARRAEGRQVDGARHRSPDQQGPDRARAPSGSTPRRTSRRSGSSSPGRFPLEKMPRARTSWPTPRPRSSRWPTETRCTCASARRRIGDGRRGTTAQRRRQMLVDMHAHVIPGALEAVGARRTIGDRGSGPATTRTRGCSRTTAACSSRRSTRSTPAERRLEELERSGVDAEVVSPMPPLLDYALPGAEGLELSRRVNEFIAELTRTDPGATDGNGNGSDAGARAGRRRARPGCGSSGSWRSRSPRTCSAARCTATSTRSSGPRPSGSRCRCSSTRCRPTSASACRPGLIPIAAFAVGADALLACAGIITSGARRAPPAICAWPSATAPAASR